MATRAGTCRYAFHSPEVVRIDETGREHRTLLPDLYLCTYLDGLPLPPPAARVAPCLEVRGSDCDLCQHYAPAGQVLLAALFLSRALARKSAGQSKP